MKNKVLLISRLNEESLALKKEVARNQSFDVQLATTAKEALKTLSSDETDLVIFNMDIFTAKKIQVATDLRALGHNLPVLVLADAIGADAYSLISDMKGTVLLEKPFENKDFHGITEKLVAGRDVQQRFFRRFYTNQLAELEIFKSGQAFPMRVRNLSKGGAFVEYKLGNLQTGDVVRVAVELKEVSRKYDMTAKVVWTTPKSPWGDGRGAGLEFINSGDVYRFLLQDV